jgi:electron transport complex protein RnfA
MIEMALKRFSPTLYNAMGIYLPLITTNCAVLGVAELVIDEAQMIGLLGITSMNLGYAVLYGLFAGLGFTLAIVVMSGLREKVARLPIAKPLKGFPIAMICACFIAMAFYVFALI